MFNNGYSVTDYFLFIIKYFILMMISNIAYAKMLKLDVIITDEQLYTNEKDHSVTLGNFNDHLTNFNFLHSTIASFFLTYFK